MSTKLACSVVPTMEMCPNCKSEMTIAEVTPIFVADGFEDVTYRCKGPPGLSARTLISRVIGPHPAPACWGVSVACQEPAAGALISVNQKYGGPPWRSREVAATLPSGPVSESSP